LIFALAVAWRVQNLDAYGLSNDEGVYLMWGRLVAGWVFAISLLASGLSSAAVGTMAG